MLMFKVSSPEEGEGRRGKQTRPSKAGALQSGPQHDTGAGDPEPEVASGSLTESYEERVKRLNRERQRRYRRKRDG